MDRTHFSKRIPDHSRLALGLFLLILLTAGTSTGRSAQEYKEPENPHQALYRIEVEDSVEAGLIEQQLKIKPVLVHNRALYYYGNEEINELLRRYQYAPVRVNKEDVLTRLVVVHRKTRDESDLVKAGVTVVLREREYWVVRGTLRQLQLVEQLGFALEEVGRREPRPRQVRIIVSRREQVAEVATLRVDIYDTTKSEKGYAIMGGAFDDSIDELKAAGFKVEILPDPPGVIR